MSQDVEIQLQVWKDLAISKQILMGAATDALGLDAECTTEELKEALDQAIRRARDADNNIQQTRSEADAQVCEYKQIAESAERARSEAESKVEVAVTIREQAERKLAAGKADNAEAIKRARAEITEMQNKLKSISKALADTPENVVRKLKALKKQKMDEAKQRGQAEKSLQKLRKEKAQLENRLETQSSLLESASGLATQVRELASICEQADQTIQKLSDDDQHRIEIPDIDNSAIEALEQALVDQ